MLVYAGNYYNFFVYDDRFRPENNLAASSASVVIFLHAVTGFRSDRSTLRARDSNSVENGESRTRET